MKVATKRKIWAIWYPFEVLNGSFYWKLTGHSENVSALVIILEQKRSFHKAGWGWNGSGAELLLLFFVPIKKGNLVECVCSSLCTHEMTFVQEPGRNSSKIILVS
jgi:hypothetical protein